MKTYKILTSFDNLIPLENYSYEIEIIDSNWPVVVTPNSGVFIPISNNYEIDTNIKFCVSSGACSGSNVFYYGANLCNLDVVPFTEFRIKLNIPYSDLSFYSKKDRVECPDCLKRHEISNLSVNFSNNKILNISGNITGLLVDRTYSYNISSLGGNYPLVVENVSGSFIAHSDTHSLVTNINFSCPSGSDFGNIFPKTYNSFRYTDILEHKLLLSVIDNCSDLERIKEIKVTENKINPSFIVPNNIILEKNSKGCSRLNFSLTNLNKDHSYVYTYNMKDANWPVYIENISGSISNTSGIADISTNIAFCPSSGLCSGLTILGEKQPNIKIDNYCSNNNTKYITLYVNVAPTCYPENVLFVSDPVTVYCKDCIAAPSIHS
jgi:hypothetical protein